MSYCVFVLDEPLSLDPAAKALNVNNIDRKIEANNFLFII
jgi:hypothetical protein